MVYVLKNIQSILVGMEFGGWLQGVPNPGSLIHEKDRCGWNQREQRWATEHIWRPSKNEDLKHISHIHQVF